MKSLREISESIKRLIEYKEKVEFNRFGARKLKTSQVKPTIGVSALYLEQRESESERIPHEVKTRAREVESSRCGQKTYYRRTTNSFESTF